MIRPRLRRPKPPPPSAEEIDWTALADGRPWRLKRGKDYRGETRPVQKAAKRAATAMGRAVVSSRDFAGKYDYVWVQFADYTLPEGQPCPRCAGTEITRVAYTFGRCDSCGASLILEEAADDDEPRESGEGASILPSRRLRSEFGDVISSRLFSSDAHEIDVLTVEEEATVEVLFRFGLPGMHVAAHLDLFSDGVKALHWGHELVVEEAGVYRLTVQIPAGLLAQKLYWVNASAKMTIGQERVRIMLRWSPAFTVRGPDDDRSRRDGSLRPDLDWDMTRLSAAGHAVPNEASADDGAARPAH